MYNKKYLKYKIKYLDLKSQVGGMLKANKSKVHEMAQETAEEVTAQAEVQAVRIEARREIVHEMEMMNTNTSAYLNNISEEKIELAKIKIVVAEAMAELIKPSYKAIDDMFIAISKHEPNPTPDKVKDELIILANKMKEACEKDTNAKKAAKIAEKGWTSDFGQRVGILWKNLMMVASEKYMAQRVYNKSEDQQWDALEKEYNTKNKYDKEREKFNPVYEPIIKANEAIKRIKNDWDKYVKYYESYRQYGAPLYYNDLITSIKEVILVWNWMKKLVLQSWFLGSHINQALIDVGITVHPQVIRTWWKVIEMEGQNFKNITL